MLKPSFAGSLASIVGQHEAMSEIAKIALIVLPSFLLAGVLVFITRGYPKRQFFILWPLIFVGWVWHGFKQGWRFDFVLLGMIVFACVMGGIHLFFKAAKHD